MRVKRTLLYKMFFTANEKEREFRNLGLAKLCRVARFGLQGSDREVSFSIGMGVIRWSDL